MPAGGSQMRHGPPTHWENGRLVTDWVTDVVTGRRERWVYTGDEWDLEEEEIA